MIRKLLGVLSLALLLALATATMAKADGLDTFTYTYDGNTFVWKLPSSPVPDGGDVYYGMGFALNNVAVSQNGGDPTLGVFGFYAAACAGGFDLSLGDIFLTSGWTQLYTGTEANPTFLTGTFQLDEFGSLGNSVSTEDDSQGAPGTLVISNATVPEPTTFSLLIVGSIGLLAFARRKA